MEIADLRQGQVGSGGGEQMLDLGLSGLLDPCIATTADSRGGIFAYLSC